MRILILTSSTGGGHDMRAASLRAWTQETRSKQLALETQIHQTLEKTHCLYKLGVTLYNTIQKTWPSLHHIYFNYLEVAGMFRSSSRILGLSRFLNVLQEYKPDLLVSVHGSLNHGFFEAARNLLGKNRIACVTYCGELYGGYGFSRHWVNPEADLFIGAVSETCKAAQDFGMPPEKTWCGGFLLNPKFYDAPLSAEARRHFIEKELGLDPNRFILLLATGAVGANNHCRLIRILEQKGIDVQLVLLSGRSARLRERLQKIASQHSKNRIKVLPYFDRMNELLQSVSAVVARAGTGTTSEAIRSTCPLIINGLGGIMPQEWITTKFCKKHGIAEIMRSPDDLCLILRRWLESPEIPDQIRSRMQATCPSQHPLDILEKLVMTTSTEAAHG